MRYDITFLVLGLVLLVGSWVFESPLGGVLAAYCAIGFLVLSFGYFLKLPAIWMKRKDGTINPLGYLLCLPLHLLNWISLRLATTSKEYPARHEIAPNLWLGRRLSAAEARRLVTSEWAVVDMTSEFSETSVLRTGRYLCLPTLDHTAPTPIQIRHALDFIAEEKPFKKVLVHCALGHGRSATVIAAWLLQNGVAKTARDADDHIRRIRAGARLKPNQLRVLNEMFSKTDLCPKKSLT
jgi:protein-tyrosine phosphatase